MQVKTQWQGLRAYANFTISLLVIQGVTWTAGCLVSTEDRFISIDMGTVYGERHLIFLLPMRTWNGVEDTALCAWRVWVRERVLFRPPSPLWLKLAMTR